MIEDYALIGDCAAAALVSRQGSVDWLCLPRFDSGACFAALLGTAEQGRWLIEPAWGIRRIRRRYRPGTLVLETEFEAVGGTGAAGVIRIVDCMPLGTGSRCILRLVEGIRGRVPVRSELIIRFDYGSIVPWVRKIDGGISAIGGPDALEVRTPVTLHGENFKTRAEFMVEAGERVPFVLTWHPSHREPPAPIDAELAIAETSRFWQKWSQRCTYDGPFREAVVRSLITLKALTFAETGGIVAAATTSLPESLGGVRNWDYRYCWLRDATATLYALMIAGYDEEARSWREWLLRAAAGKPSELQIMYGLAGERRLTELILPWLDGYKGAVPVRIGNAAASQFQLDVYGEVMHVLHQTHRQTRQLKGRAKETSLGTTVDLWNLQRSLVEFLEGAWQLPDEGIWETRGGRQHFTYSKIMAWVAFSRAIRSAESFGEKGMDKLAHWRQVRDEIHRQVCERGYDPELGAFVQSYGSKQLDASLLMVPLVGFLPANDSRVRNTVAAIERHLLHDGFVMRYRSEPVPGNSQGKAGDGLPPGEGVFLMCSFWYADNLMLLGRYRDAWHLFRRLLDVRNDVGLLSEEYDPDSRCLLGNFPQAFSHVALINTAHNLAESCGRSEFRVA